MLVKALLISVLVQGSAETTAVSDLSPYRIDPVLDTSLTVGALGMIFFASTVVEPTLKLSPSCSIERTTGFCDPEELNILDRSVVGNWSSEWRLVSDVTNGIAYALPLIVGAIDSFTSGSSTPWSDWGKDLLVATEAGALASLVTTLLKFSIRRPRPTQYNPTLESRFGATRHQLSFPSGHTSVTAAVSSAYAMTFALRHPESNWRWFFYGGAATLTLLTGYARVGGGMHFYTDVLAGALLGTAIGVLVPWLHHRHHVTLATLPLQGHAPHSRPIGASFQFSF